jgi:hypothetical protein
LAFADLLIVKTPSSEASRPALDLPMKKKKDRVEYPWMRVLKLDHSWQILGEIAVRFEPLV